MFAETITSVTPQGKGNAVKGKNLFWVAFLVPLFSGCAVFQSPKSWDADPAVLDANNTQFEAIAAAPGMSELVAAGNTLRKSIQSSIAEHRKNLNYASAGNYGAGLLAAGVALANLHRDALMAAGFLGGTHVALSQRLSPREYIQQLQRTSDSLYCLSGVAGKYQEMWTKATEVSKAQNNVMEPFAPLGFSSTPEALYLPAVSKARQAFMRALEVSQAKLDAQISLTQPSTISDELVTKIRDGADKGQAIMRTRGSSQAVEDFLVIDAELDGKLEACLTKL